MPYLDAHISFVAADKDRPYGISDLAPDVPSGYRDGTLINETNIKCCIHGCDQWVSRRRRSRALDVTGLFCPQHGISVSSAPTYIYEDYTRNFIVGRAALANVSKVEKWRLGNETSEDALSWNVFVGLLASAGLKECFEMLTGVKTNTEPELFLWGNRINDNASPQQFDGLIGVRRELEPDTRIPTEPDIILRVPGEAIVLIEAKFGSPNGRFAGKEQRFGGIDRYLSRYRARPGTDDPLDRKWIREQDPSSVLEQLCRNVVFAHWLSQDGEIPFVINLVDRHAELDVETELRRHIRPKLVNVVRRTWDDVCNLATLEKEGAAPLRSYLANKTLRLQKAFSSI